MSDILVRIPLAGDSEFLPLALAPGLPMLDPRRLTYQVLLGWFGDLLAEPELDEHGVAFYAQRNGRRLTIAERALATDLDLAGPLASDFQRLRKSLFEVRPVSPSEKLIFNRLQPPFINHEGFLYRVRATDNSEHLVWCWGYQRRATDGHVRLCPNPACHALLIERDVPLDACPHCAHSFVKSIGATVRKTRRPIGAVTAIAALGALIGGTYWFGAHAGHQTLEDLAEVLLDGPPAQIEKAQDSSSNRISENPYSENLATANARRSKADTERAFSETGAEQPLLPSTPNTFPEPAKLEIAETTGPVRVIDLPDPIADAANGSDDANGNFNTDTNSIASSNPAPGASLNGTAASDTGISSADVPVIEERSESSEKEALSKLPDSGSDSADNAVETNTANNKSVSGPKLGLPEPAEPESSDAIANKPAATESIGTDGNAASSRETADNSQSDRKTTNRDTTEDGKPLVLREVPQQKLVALTWHEDYLQGYHEAMQKHRLLLMVFRDLAEPDRIEKMVGGLGDPSLRSALEDVVRVTLPVNATAPGQSPALLLQHRSFRHLGVRPGLILVDLRDQSRPTFGRVISAVPLPANGQYSSELLETLFALPEAGIGLRTFLLTTRTSIPGSVTGSGEMSAALNELATRNAKLMSQSPEAAEADRETRLAAIAATFGSDKQISELTFATDSAVSIQEAAIQAVQDWLTRSAEEAALMSRTGSFGADMVQGADGRWFVSCLIVRRP